MNASPLSPAINPAPGLPERARRYLAATPPAVSGSGGEPATWRAARALVKGFGLTPEQALPLLCEWNARCVPPWEERALRAKLSNAARSTGAGGWLLREDSRPAPPPAVPAWPVFTRPDAAAQEAIAQLRGVSVEAVQLLVAHRYLWCCRRAGEDCWAIRSGAFAQVRRMDGQPFPRRDDSPVKALNLPGSRGRFLNPGGCGDPSVPVLLTEGAVSLLEMAELVRRADAQAGRLHAVALVAAVSASIRFTAADAAPLAGRRVRIMADADGAGKTAAAAWAARLRETGCRVDCLAMPGGCKDPGDALRTLPASHALWRQLLIF